MEVVNDQFKMLDVPSDCNVMDFVRVHIPGYRAESGYGYHEFKNKMYLLPDTKLMLMDKVMHLERFVTNLLVGCAHTYITSYKCVMIDYRMAKFTVDMVLIMPLVYQIIHMKLSHQHWKTGSTYLSR